MSKKTRKKSPKTASKAKSSAKPAAAKARASKTPLKDPPRDGQQSAQIGRFRTFAQGRIENVKIIRRRAAESSRRQGLGCG